MLFCASLGVVLRRVISLAYFLSVVYPNSLFPVCFVYTWALQLGGLWICLLGQGCEFH